MRCVKRVRWPTAPRNKNGAVLQGHLLRYGTSQALGHTSTHAVPSRVSRARFASTPPTYWPIEPSLRTTRWQGTTMGRGLVAHAVPTARTAFGLPTATAMAL